MSKIEELEALQEAITEDNTKIDSLALLLQLAEPSMHGETRLGDLGEEVTIRQQKAFNTLERLIYDVGGAIRDYTDRISSALSDLQYILEQMEDTGKGAEAG